MKRKMKVLSFLLAFSMILFIIITPHRVYARDAEKTQCGVVFLGDSTTNAFSNYGLVPEHCVWTGIGNTLSMWDVSRKQIKITQKALSEYKKLENYPKYADKIKTNGKCFSMSVSDIVKMTSPEIIVITLGINGCSCMSETAFEHEYRSLIDTIKNSSQKTQIFLNSVLPVANRSNKVKNEDVKKACKIIKKLAAEYSLNYIDTFSYIEKIKNGTDDIPTEILDSQDGIHYSAYGCKKIIEFIETEIKK